MCRLPGTNSSPEPDSACACRSIAETLGNEARLPLSADSACRSIAETLGNEDDEGCDSTSACRSIAETLGNDDGVATLLPCPYTVSRPSTKASRSAWTSCDSSHARYWSLWSFRSARVAADLLYVRALPSSWACRSKSLTPGNTGDGAGAAFSAKAWSAVSPNSRLAASARDSSCFVYWSAWWARAARLDCSGVSESSATMMPTVAPTAAHTAAAAAQTYRARRRGARGGASGGALIPPGGASCWSSNVSVVVAMTVLPPLLGGCP